MRGKPLERADVDVVVVVLRGQRLARLDEELRAEEPHAVAAGRTATRPHAAHVFAI